MSVPSKKPGSSSPSKESGYATMAVSIHSTNLIALCKLTSPKCQLPRLDVFHTHPLPVKQITQSFCSVPLIDSLSLTLLREFEHRLCQLVDGLIYALHPAIDNVYTVVLCILDQLLHVAAETR